MPKILDSKAEAISPHSRLNVTLVEMKVFIATILNMGLHKKPSNDCYWSTKQSQAQPWFSKMMSRNRFEILLKFFHIVDNNTLVKIGEPGYDPCARFQILIDHCNFII